MGFKIALKYVQYFIKVAGEPEGNEIRFDSVLSQ